MVENTTEEIGAMGEFQIGAVSESVGWSLVRRDSL
jgi:hypothetical protein